MGSVLVHIDLDADRPHPASMSALAAGRALASSWGATLYAALVVPGDSAAAVPGLDEVQSALARAGADKVVIALNDAPVVTLWASVGAAWQGVLDQLRPRVVLFGADAPSAAELGARTAAKIGARLLSRARAVGSDEIELRDRDGSFVRSGDSGASVALVGGSHAAPLGDEDIDLVVSKVVGRVDPTIELAATLPAEVTHTGGALVVLGSDVADDPAIALDAARLAALLGAPLVAGTATGRARAPVPGAIERGAPLAPEVCVVIGTATVDLAGSSSLVRIGKSGTKGVDGALTGDIAANLRELCLALEST